MAKRYATYFGVPIPPFKEEKLGAGSTTIRFVLKGNVPSLKNGRQAAVVRKAAIDHLKGKSTNGMVSLKEAEYAIRKLVYGKVTPNDSYREWAEINKPIILQQMNYWSERLQVKGLFFPLDKATMSIRFYFANDYNIDSISKQESVQDLLVLCKVIQDDCYKILNPIYTSSAQYKDELVDSICFVSLSFRI